MRLSDIVKIIGGEIQSAQPKNADPEITSVAPIEIAKPSEISFLSNPYYAKYLTTTKAAAVLVKQFSADAPVVQLVHKNPYLAFAKLAGHFHKPKKPQEGVSPKAHVSKDAKIGKNVAIYPFVYVGEGAEIADNVTLYPGVVVGDKVKIGHSSTLFANAVVYDHCEIGANVLIHSGCIVGADGFGYAVGDGEIVKIPQVGKAVIEDNVELGANATIDRAAMGVTRIGKGTKIDSQVQVAHNCDIGENCMLSAFTGIAGSTKLGKWVVMGGQSGANGHIKIADGCTIGGRGGVTKTLTEKGVYAGFPITDASSWRRQQVYIKRLGELEKRIRDLEKNV